MLTFKYIDDKYINNLKAYKYKGGDNSIYYNYVISPVCNFIVKYTPKCIAPNVITISGFFINLINLIITTYYGGWKGSDYYPPWVCYFTSFSYSFYIYLDALDGKQARRLNASSPLGLLFDHGTDACSSFYVPIVTGSISYYNNIYQYLLLYFPIMTTFFFNTWEEYYTGELVLPAFNGVEEGSVIISVAHLFSGIYGTSLFFKSINIFGFFNCNFNIFCGLGTFIGGIIFTIYSFFGVLLSIPRNKILNALKTSLIYFLFLGSLMSVIILNDSIIVKEYPKFLIIIYGLLFAKMMGILQVSHILKSPFEVYRPAFLVPLLSVLIHSIIYFFSGKAFIINVDVLLYIIFVWNFFSWLHFTYYCSEEICEILNINRFVLGPKYTVVSKENKSE